MMMYGGGPAMGGGGYRRMMNRPDEPPKKTDIRTVRRVAASFRPYLREVLIVFAAIIVVGVMGIINPLMLKYSISIGFGQQRFDLLVVFVAVMIIVPIITGLIGVGQTYLNSRIGQNVMRDFRNRLYTHLQRMPLKFFTDTRTGEIQSRLANDVGGVQAVVTDTATSTISNLTTVLATVIGMFVLSWQLTLLSLGLLPVFIFLTTRVGAVRREVSKETQESLAEMSSMVQETLSVSGVLLTKTYGRQRQEIARFDKENQRLVGLQIRQQMVGRWFMMVIGTFFSIIPALVYLLAGYLAFGPGHTSSPTQVAEIVGTLVAFTTLQTRL
ncbi:MAG TPA: ABC transporter ATP-binding protein, partial [Ktedonobacterales bacterium]